MPEDIISDEDWSEYDRIKTVNGEELSLFNCKQQWEVEYLVSVLQKRLDYLLPAITLTTAITAACEENKQPLSREAFIDEVMLRLIT